jgi:hypothetical protein
VDSRGQPAGERYAAGRDAEQDDARGAGRLLEDLMSDPVDDPMQVGPGQNGLTRTNVGSTNVNTGVPWVHHN